MITIEDIENLVTHKVTVICMERFPGYPDPLLYTVDAPVNASPDEVKEMVIQERIEDLGWELEAEVRDNFEPLLAVKGEVEYLFDHRT